LLVYIAEMVLQLLK